jgi:mannosyl-oligosaccharide alpha-1,2-mannosidase
MFALGGKLFNEPHHVRVGERLTRGCMLAYAATPTGIMPEIFEAVPCVDKTECVWNETVWVAAVLKHFGPKYTGLPEKAISDQRLPPGFASIRDTRYVLRPEAIESVFVLYRITGASEWREGAWAMFSAVESATRVEAEGGGRKWGSYAALKDVTVIEGERADIMETFWTAETLKYFYLCFSPTDLVGLDEWVLNTEAHPFRRPI